MSISTTSTSRTSTAQSSVALLPVCTTMPAGPFSRIVTRTILRILDRTTRFLQRTPRRLDGVEHLRSVKSPFIIAPNHISLIDTPMIHLALPRDVARCTAVIGGLDFFAPRHGKSWMFNTWRRVVVWFLRSSMNVVLIDRRGGDYSNLEQIEGLMRDGWNIIIFPEASRSRDGQLGRLRSGVAELARRFHSPVIPCSIRGTNQVLPVGKTLPQHGSMHIQLGKPITFEHEESTRDFVERLRSSIPAIPVEDTSS